MESGVLNEPLWDVATVPYPYPSNGIFVREYTIKLLSSSFPNMTTVEVLKQTLWTLFRCLFDVSFMRLPASVFVLFQVTQFVNGLLGSRDDLSEFKDHIRDFLVQSKEFSAQVKFLLSLLVFICTSYTTCWFFIKMLICWMTTLSKAASEGNVQVYYSESLATWNFFKRMAVGFKPITFDSAWFYFHVEWRPHLIG